RYFRWERSEPGGVVLVSAWQRIRVLLEHSVGLLSDRWRLLLGHSLGGVAKYLHAQRDGVRQPAFSSTADSDSTCQPDRADGRNGVRTPSRWACRYFATPPRECPR